jgi:glycine/D-amino acid oxidase-like deaminating enzyme
MEGAAAQVTPLELTEKLIAASGAEVRLSTAATGIITQETTKSGEVKVTGVSLSDGTILAAEKVIIAAGPWSGVMIEDWFGLSLPMQGVRSSSMVFRDCKPVEKEFAALFCSEDENGCHAELYPRHDGSIYMCGLGGSAYIQGDALRPGGSEYNPESIKPDATRITAGLKTFRKISSLGDAGPALIQACMRPLLPDGLPAMGLIPGVQGAYISCGHNCWGILWAPVSGYAMAELVASGKSEVINLKPFRMDRFFTSETKRGRKQGKEDVGEQW